MKRAKSLGLVVLLGGALCGFGGCGLRSLGAGLLSEFLTSGTGGTLGSILNSGISDLLNQAGSQSGAGGEGDEQPSEAV